MNDEVLKKIDEYLKENCTSISKKVDESFESKKDVIRNSLLLKIQQYISENPLVHYEWEPNPYEYWDESGVLVEDGTIDLTIK